MLIRNTYLGNALASHFTDSASGTVPDYAVVLMRGHGLTVLAPTIQDCVLRAVYTQKNASIQTTSLLTHAAHFESNTAAASPIKYLSEDECRAAVEMTRSTAMRPWGLWLREVEAAGLYVNQG
jgi:ribulose-5-phosphate 4-epimerase/fuculose-1-phosphate aldolase